jgi:DGQHR domain-containing protein
MSTATAVAPAATVQTTAAAKVSKMEIEATLIPGKVAVATITPDKLKALAFISSYSTEDQQSTSPQKHGYQREPMEERFPGIGRYYNRNDNRNRIPALIISVRVYDAKGRTRFNTLFNQGAIAKIHREFGKSVFSIVDGQHRMGGLYWAWKNYEDFNAFIPLTLYYGMTYTEEANLFDDINTSQRKLPKALIEVTKAHTEAGEKSHAQTLREIAMGLAEDRDSVWKGLVNMTGAKSKDKLPVTFEGLRRSTGGMLKERILNRIEARGLNPERVVKVYWEMVSKACAAAWQDRPVYTEDAKGETEEVQVKYRLKELVGVSAVSLLGADIISTSLDKTSNNEDFWGVMSEYVGKLAEVDWIKSRNNPFTATSAGFGGSTHLYSILYALVYEDRLPGDELTS